MVPEVRASKNELLLNLSPRSTNYLEAKIT
jgi:hypothetical protein